MAYLHHVNHATALTSLGTANRVTPCHVTHEHRNQNETTDQTCQKMKPHCNIKINTSPMSSATLLHPPTAILVKPGRGPQTASFTANTANGPDGASGTGAPRAPLGCLLGMLLSTWQECTGCGKFVLCILDFGVLEGSVCPGDILGPVGG